MYRDARLTFRQRPASGRGIKGGEVRKKQPMPNLYVTAQGARVEREYERLVVVQERETLLDVPAIKVEEVVLVGRIGVTTPALHLMMERGIGMVMLNQHGEFLGRLSGDQHANVDLRRAQYRRSQEAGFRLGAARAVTRGKLWNSRVRCLRIAADTQNAVAQRTAERLDELLDELPAAPDQAHVRALEAEGSRAYFAVLRSHVAPEWDFPSRNRRPPLDPFNVLLSACYTLLTEAVHAAVLLAGLDPYCGFYHAERWGRPSLVLDLMEEFRPLIADSTVMTLTMNRLLAPKDFLPGPPERPVILPLERYTEVLNAFGQRLRSPVTVSRLNRRTTYHRLLEYQARQFAAAIQGKNEGYEPFRSR